MYAYARASLLRYARWMAVGERPYLERADRLEYPTETWSAQDMRKSDVFHFAAKHAAGDERACFLARAGFFFRSSIEELSQAKTRTLTRPVVILMTSGYMRAYFQHHPDESAPDRPSDLDFGEPERFVPQRERIRRRARLVGAVATGGLTLAAGAVLAALRTVGAGAGR
jgi:hypothetical protein